MFPPTRPKARGLAQHGGSPVWLEKSDPTGVILYVMYGQYSPLFRTVPATLTGAAKMRADGISSSCYIINVHNRMSWSTRKAWPGALVDPCILSGSYDGVAASMGSNITMKVNLNRHNESNAVMEKTLMHSVYWYKSARSYAQHYVTLHTV